MGRWTFNVICRMLAGVGLAAALLATSGCGEVAQLKVQHPVRCAFCDAKIVEPLPRYGAKLNRWCFDMDAGLQRPAITVDGGPQEDFACRSSVVAVKYADEEEQRIVWAYVDYTLVVSLWLSPKQDTLYFTILDDVPTVTARTFVYAYDLDRRKMVGYWPEYDRQPLAGR